MDDQPLAVAVEQIVCGRAAQPFAHRPDVRLDDAPAERIVERGEAELGEKVGGIVGRHGATFAPDEFTDKAAATNRARRAIERGTGRGYIPSISMRFWPSAAPETPLPRLSNFATSAA